MEKNKLRGKKFLWTLFILTFLATTAMVSVPVSSSPETRVYVKMPDGHIPGVPVGNYFLVEVWIENAVDLNQWSLSVQVDPAVIEVWTAIDGSGTVIKDYVDYLWWPPGDVFVIGSVNKTEGKIIDISHAINAWPNLYNDTYCQENIGMDAPGGFNGSGKLCTLRFKSKSETDYSLIHLFDVLLFDGLYNATGTPHYFPPDTVEDGHYNEPPAGGDVAVTNVAPSISEGFQTWTIQLNVTVSNSGTQTINSNVTAYYGASTWYEIGTQLVTDLAQGANTTLTFNWELAGLTMGTSYTVKANATLIDLSDVNPGNNEFVNGQVRIRLTGDASGDDKVTGLDQITVGVHLYEKLGDPNWEPYADVSGDNKVTGLDQITVGVHLYEKL